MPKKHLNGSSELYVGAPNMLLEAFGPDIAAKASKIFGTFPFVEIRHSRGKGNGKWQKGGLIKGKPKLTKRGW